MGSRRPWDRALASIQRFFSYKTAALLDEQRVEFTLSVPFERYLAPKGWPLVDRVPILLQSILRAIKRTSYACSWRST
jgi:hypothetical protein